MMETQAPRFISIVRTIGLSVATVLLIAAVALSSGAQNSQSTVPASAVQAARKPEVAAKLAHPTTQPRSQAQPPRPMPGGTVPGGGNTVYDNGPINGSVDAWTINFGFAVTDSFTLNSATTIAGFQFGAWATPGDTPYAIDYSIDSSPFGGIPTTVPLQSQYLYTNQFGYDIDEVTASNLNLVLQPGTYWLTLQNAATTQGEPLYWDENSGPSQAEDSAYGTIPSESFSVQGSDNGESSCYREGGGNLHTLYTFSQQQGAPYPNPSGVVMDKAGNLYGASLEAGANGAGFVYKLFDLGGWLLDPLFSFFGGSAGGPPSGAILGPNQTLYGSAGGGIQNCGSDGSQYCGVIFNLAPSPVACRSALCGWNETLPYRFTSEADGSGTITVGGFDQQGNLYGTTSTGGSADLGTVFELTQSAGGWTKTILYNFTGDRYGKNPTQVLVGNDGNLYGIAGGGFYGKGVAFQLTPSGGQWIPSVAHAFGGSDGDFNVASLVQDAGGSLYGVADFSIEPSSSEAAIFSLVKTDSGWNFSQYLVSHDEITQINNLTTDAAGNLYGTGDAWSQIAGAGEHKSPGYGHYWEGFIFKASRDGEGWHYQDLKYLDQTYFFTSGSLALDPNGNLYGTTLQCGVNDGTVWQLSP